MCLSALPVSLKLRRLAKAVARNRRFNQMDSQHCSIAIGLRFDPVSQTFNRKTHIPYNVTACEVFANKYGVSRSEARDIWVGYDGMQEVVTGRGDVTQAEQTRQAVALLERVAVRYEAVGN